MQKFFRETGYLFICLILVFVLIAALFWALSIGTVNLPMDKIYATVVEQLESGGPVDEVGKGPVHDVIWLLRFPRLILAALVGMGLATCGVIMQAIVKNPLADP